MASQLGYDPTYDQYYAQDPGYSLANDNLHPYNYNSDAQPHKRVRLSQDVLPDIDTARAAAAHHDSLASAPPQNGTFSLLSATVSVSEPPHPRSSSVPPKSKAGRKKKVQQNLADPFVQESFAFPKKQTWLTPRPRQRKTAVEIPQETASEKQPATNESFASRGTLFLDKHKDRIAALIARKRKDNDSKLFRERMAMQQRLHHGEDDNDRLIAASHNELKRKMELSAQGIYDERRSDNNDSENILTHPSESLSAQPGNSDSDTAAAPGFMQPPQSEHTDTLERHLSHNEDGTEPDIEEEIISAQAFEHAEHLSSPNPHGEQSITHSSYDQDAVQASFWHRQTVVTETYAHADQSSYDQGLPVQTHTTYPATPLFMAQPRFTSQRYSHTQMMMPEQNIFQHQYNEAGPVMPAQPHRWTSQMWHALPNASTPLLQSTTVVQSSHTPLTDSNVHTRGYMHQPIPINRSSMAHLPTYEPAGYDLNYYSDNPSSRASSADSSASGIEDVRAFLSYNPYQSQQSQGQYDQQQQSQTGSRTNVNIFTRQERENGVIGGNNNWATEPNGERRRNMFDNRTG